MLTVRYRFPKAGGDGKRVPGCLPRHGAGGCHEQKFEESNPGSIMDEIDGLTEPSRSFRPWNAES